MNSSAACRFRGGAYRKAGFTLLELLVVIAIIGILATLYVPEISTLRERAEKVVCMGHLRSLHAALGAYLNDNEVWPQYSQDANGNDVDLSPQDDAQFWLTTLQDYGVTARDWKCPTLTRLLALNADSGTVVDPNAPQMHYTVASFDDNPLTPRKWPGQPWLWEIANIHHGGTLMIRADGAVQIFEGTVPDASGQ